MIQGIVYGVLLTKVGEATYFKHCMEDYAWRHQIKLDTNSIHRNVEVDYVNASYFKKYYNVERKVDLPDHIDKWSHICIDQTNGPIIYIKESAHEANINTNRLSLNITTHDRWFHDMESIILVLSLEIVDKIGWYLIHAED